MKGGFLLTPSGSFDLARRNRLAAGRVRRFPARRANGFTLLELLLATAVSALLLTGGVLSIYSIMVGIDRSNRQAIALADANHAALIIKNDLLMAQVTDLVNGVPKSSANLSWYDYTSSFGTGFQTAHNASYVLSGRQLLRTYDGVTSIVGRNVISISFTQQVSQEGRKAVTVTISTSNTTPPSEIQTLTFTVHLREEEVN